MNVVRKNIGFIYSIGNLTKREIMTINKDSISGYPDIVNYRVYGGNSNPEYLLRKKIIDY